MSDQFEVHLLGRFSVRRSGEEIPPGAFGGRLVRALIRLLLTRRGEFVSHDVLAEALWPVRMPADPVANLKVLVNRARTGLGDPGLIITGSGGYSFAGGDACRVDAEAFLAAVADGQRHRREGRAAFALQVLRSALDAWGGEPLAEDAYEDWARHYRATLFSAHLQALEEGATAALALRDSGQAVALAEAAVAREPLREAAHLVLAEAQAASGDLVAALRTIDSFRRRLGEEVGLPPSEAILDLEQRLQRGDAPKPPASRPVVGRSGVAFDGLAFVGRDRELGATLSAIEASPPGVVLVQGPAGAGKSRLLREVAGHAGCSVLAARAFQAEQEESWSLARSLLREALALDLDAAADLPERIALALADVVPELDEIRPVSAVSIDPESRRALALEGAVRLITTVASKGVLLLVDDAQWADPTSLVVIGAMARRVPTAGLVVSYRPVEMFPEGPLSTLLDEVAAARAVTEVPIAALPADTLTQLFADPALADAIARATDRTPLAVAEVVRRLAVDGAIESGADGRWLARRSDAVRLAEDIGRAGQRQSIARRAARQPAARREILSLLALLGREAPARLLAAAARRQQAPVLDDLDGLARAGLVRLGDAGWATAHDVIGESVADALSREERGRLQQALATALLESEGDPAEVARHLSGAGDREAAAEAFARAASERLERYADEEALVLADSGLALDPDPAVLTSLLETRAEARGRKGDAPGARHDLRQALVHLRAPEQRARVLSKLSILTSSEDASESVALASAALAEAGSDPRSRAEALAAAAFAAGNSDQPSAAEPLVNEARALFETLGDARGLATTVDAQANACFLHGRLEEAATLYNRAARLYRDSGQLTKVGWPLMMVAWCLNLMGRPDEARRGIDYALELERSLGQLEGEAAALLVGAQTAFEAGDTDEARARMPAVLSACDAISSRELLSAALTLAGRLSQAAGEVDEAVVSFKRALEVGGDLAFFVAEAASALAECLLARGELADAVSYATRATAFEIGPGPIEGHLLLAEIACLRKEPGAEAQAREALRRANANDYRASANRLRLEQLVGSGPGSDPASRQRRTFMFTDIVGSTRLLELMGDEAWGHLLRWHDQVLRDLFAAHGGEEVNRMGDGFFVAFERADAAIACAVAVQRALARHRGDHRFAPEVRIGVHWAEATREGADYQGRGVHEAARIGGMAAAGEILVSQATLGGVALGGVDGIRCSPPRPIQLKGFSDQVDVVSVEWR